MNTITQNNLSYQNYQKETNNLYNLVMQIGTKTYFYNTPGKHAQFNTILVDNIVNHGAKIIPYLVKFLETTNNDTAIAEGALIAQKLAEKNVTGYEKLYAPLAKHSNHPCPVVQVMIAGAMRTIGEPSAVGPLSRMLYKNLQYPPVWFTFDPAEEIAGSLIELIAQRSAINIMQKLEPRLQKIEHKLNING